ncbi:N-acylhomoserine lactone synthase [soil metagenome]
MLDIHEQDFTAVPDAVMRGMFAARKAVFVDLLKWHVPVLEGRYEVDQFDTAHARYLIMTDREGQHLGSARLLPTTKPHILDTLYPQLCAEGPPCSEQVYEITRFCLDRGLRADDRRIVRNMLVGMLVDHALATGIVAYTAIAEMGWFQQILAFGWRCRPLGLPQVLDGSMLAALRIEVTGETPRMLEQTGIIAMPPIHDSVRFAA